MEFFEKFQILVGRETLVSKMLYQLVNKTLFKQIIFSYNKTLIGIDLIQHAANYTLDSTLLSIHQRNVQFLHIEVNSYLN